MLKNSKGENVFVEEVRHEFLNSPIKIYNFEVEGNHTYFVGERDGLVVHNAACYLGKNKNTGKSYVGRTKRENVAIRIGEHAKNKIHHKDLVNVTYLDGLTNEQSKLLEQALINSNGGIKKLDNLINGMSTKNPLYKDISTIGDQLLELFKKCASKL